MDLSILDYWDHVFGAKDVDSSENLVRGRVEGVFSVHQMEKLPYVSKVKGFYGGGEKGLLWVCYCLQQSLRHGSVFCHV